MQTDPLIKPAGRALLEAFLTHFALPGDLPPDLLLGAVTRAFSRLPYENLTKIIKEAESTNRCEARRGPAEVFADHSKFGTGGTCFSLTATFLYLVHALGWRAEPILADRRYGAATHCALLIWIDASPHLLDPGYLVLKPVSLRGEMTQSITTPFNRLILTPRAGGGKLDLSTVQEERETYRLTYRLQPADSGEFLKAWDASFDWDMMHYPLLTRVAGSRQLYLKGNRMQVRCGEAVSRAQIRTESLAARIEDDFGIAVPVAARALAILKRRGDLHGQARTG